MNVDRSRFDIRVDAMTPADQEDALRLQKYLNVVMRHPHLQKEIQYALNMPIDVLYGDPAEYNALLKDHLNA